MKEVETPPPTAPASQKIIGDFIAVVTSSKTDIVWVQAGTEDGNCPKDLEVLFFQSLTSTAPVHFPFATYIRNGSRRGSSHPPRAQGPDL